MQKLAEADDQKAFTLIKKIMTVTHYKDGFYPALGTPLDENGVLVDKSFEGEIESMISSGASGFLCMGSMGRMESVRNSEYPEIAKKCVAFVKKRVPVLVGVMDCSIARVLDRISALGDLDIDGVVTTAPFYSRVSDTGIINFFSKISKVSKYPVFIYDLPSVAQVSITAGILKKLAADQNIKGLKTANFNLILDLFRDDYLQRDFSIFYSGLDSFDAAIKSGIKRNLDGMFTCTPNNSGLMYKDIENGSPVDISMYLDNILRLRNIFVKEDVLAGYSYAMELLGCPGNYHCDYSDTVSAKLKQEIRDCMKNIKEI
jgi:4-hydroxy-tetrahydrodipicolinate synthase